MLIFFNILTSIIALAGCISLFISGEINPVFSLAGAALFYGYYRLMTNMPQAPKWSISMLSVITLILFLFDAFMVSDDYLISVANLTIFFQAIKSYDLREPWDHLQVSFMSLLQLIIASEFTHSIAFGVLFIFFLTAIVNAIILAHFIKAGTGAKIPIKKPLIYLSLLTIFVTAIIFIAAPRITGGLWGKGRQKSIKTAGFSEKVDFGSFGDVKLDPTIVMRVKLSAADKGPYYWRGMSHNYFDGISWREAAGEKRWIYKRDGFFIIRPFRKEKAVIQSIYLEPMDTEVIFGLSEVVAVEANSRAINVDEARAIFVPFKKGKQFFYTAYSVSEAVPENSETGFNLQVPEGIEKVKQLARSITARITNDALKSLAIERYLRENFTYTLSTSEPPEGVSPIEDFLFNSRKGYCEHYATAMVLMLRSVGIPSRIVTGFYGGEMNAYGGYMIVRQSNAHSWVEALINKKWLRFDPTPAVAVDRPSAIVMYLDMLKMQWDRYVVSYSSYDQREIMRVITMPFRLPRMPELSFKGFKGVAFTAAPAAIMLTALLLIIFKAFKRKRYGFVTAQYVKLRKDLKKKGLKISPYMTSQEMQRAAAKSGFDGNISEFVRIYEKYRFGNKLMPDEEKVRYRQLLKEIKKQ
jgi:transglutaminase-like putative cysteine protease